MSALLVTKTLGLFFITAIAEIVGCYLPYLWLKKDGSAWLLIPAAISLVHLVTHLAPSGKWPSLCSLWWGICGNCVALVKSRGRGVAVYVRCCGCCFYFNRYGNNSRRLESPLTLSEGLKPRASAS